MYLRSVSIQAIRNLQPATIEWSPGFNYLYGPNGAGKTAILEAIHTLSMGRSFRTRKTQSLITHNQDEFVLRGTVEGTSAGVHQLAMSRQRDGQVRLRIDGENRSKVSDLAKLLPVQVMLPDTSEIVLGSPGRRRSFLDWGLFHVEQRYLRTATEYSRTLSQRNAWLKTVDLSGPTQIDPWHDQLVQSGVAISAMRQQFLSSLDAPLKDLLNSFTIPGALALELKSGGMADATEAAKKMSENWSRDVKLGSTHTGPHRADLLITIDDQPASEILSRGQAKLVACALILAQIHVLREEYQQPTLVLIDDYGAELDNVHWVNFSRTLKNLGCQVIATSNELPDRAIAEWAGAGDFRLFHVEHGGVSQEVGRD